jgi:hypothetical protein
MISSRRRGSPISGTTRPRSLLPGGAEQPFLAEFVSDLVVREKGSACSECSCQGRGPFDLTRHGFLGYESAPIALPGPIAVAAYPTFVDIRFADVGFSLLQEVNPA